MKIIYPLQVVLILLITFSICFAERTVWDQFSGCKIEQRICSAKKNNKPIKLIKADQAEFKRCPDTTQLCMEGGSEVFVNDTSAVHIEEYGTLNIFDGGSLSVFDNGFCRISKGSHLKINPNARITINKARLSIFSYSVFENGGLTSFDLDSKITILYSSQVIIGDPVPPFPSNSFIVGPESTIQVEYSSVILIERSSQMITIANNNLGIHRYSELIIRNSSVIMHNNSKIYMEKNSALEVGGILCSNKNKSELLVGNNSRIFMEEGSQIKLSSGKIILKDAFLWIGQNSQLHVHGILEIEVKAMSMWQHITIGGYNENCDPDASLVITNSRVIPAKGLLVNNGAHCFTKAEVVPLDENATKVELNENSETNKFKCFNSRNALLVALGRSPTTTF